MTARAKSVQTLIDETGSLVDVLQRLSARSRAVILECLTAHVEGRLTFDEAMSEMRKRCEGHLQCKNPVAQ